MFSNKTLLALIRLTDNFEHSEMNRVLSIFNIGDYNPIQKKTVIAKGTYIFHYLKDNKGKGPFTNNIHIDFLQYLIDDFFELHPNYEDGAIVYNGNRPTIRFENAFSENNREIANNLKRDGYIIIGRNIKKLLPEEIEEAKIESELMVSLDNLYFTRSKGHLEQAISNHSQGNWAGANSQFRTFIESLLIEINNKLMPNNAATSGAQAIKLLSETINPPFLSKDLNEVPKSEKDDSFVWGLWVRLHPEGSHPGLSGEDDSSFRYHLSIVFANYLLRRLKSFKNVSA